MPDPFSLEAVILGRNDDYEPNWTENLFAAIAYNRARFEGSRVDFRVAFVEWNPPAGKPLLSPDLLERYPFLRAIVVDREVHDALCAVRELPMMINFGFNAAFRTTAADFTMTTCGDDLWSTSLVRRICKEGLKPSHLYRAERASVKRDLPFARIDPQTLERPENVLFVDTCTQPPYDVPPYTNACGDFSLTDSGTMFAFGGMDESIREARLHLDSRLCINAMAVVEECVLLGQIFHITHATSFGVQKKAKGREYVWDDGMPYVNPPNWGLADHTWERVSDRYYRVSLPRPGAAPSVPEKLPIDARARAADVRECLLEIRKSVHPERPVIATRSLTSALDLWTVAATPAWQSSIQRREDLLYIETSPTQWSPAVVFPFKLTPPADDEHWHWTRALLHVTEGAVAISVVDESLRVLAERYLYSDSDEEVFIPSPAAARHVLIRNLDGNSSRSLVTMRALELVTHPKHVGATA
jgi:hypothetical protein